MDGLSLAPVVSSSQIIFEYDLADSRFKPTFQTPPHQPSPLATSHFPLFHSSPEPKRQSQSSACDQTYTPRPRCQSRRYLKNFTASSPVPPAPSAAVHGRASTQNHVMPKMAVFRSRRLACSSVSRISSHKGAAIFAFRNPASMLLLIAGRVQSRSILGTMSLRSASMKRTNGLFQARSPKSLQVLQPGTSWKRRSMGLSLLLREPRAFSKSRSQST